MSTYEQLADIPLEVEAYELEGLEQDVSSDFTRASTVIHMRGGGEEGIGEDVTYAPEEHLAGVLYLFLRGMSGAATPRVDGQPCGVFAWRPPTPLIEELSDLLDRGRAAT